LYLTQGRAIKLGDKEIEYNPNFRLILHTKLANPHYKPEMQAQTTLINFTVTRDGLEDQLLAAVVAKVNPLYSDHNNKHTDIPIHYVLLTYYNYTLSSSIYPVYLLSMPSASYGSAPA